MRWIKTGLVVALAFSAMGCSSVPSRHPGAAPVDYDRQLDASGLVLSSEARYGFTQQGLTEADDFHTRLQDRGLVSPNGWILDCPGFARATRHWVDLSASLTRVYVGAVLLEKWGLQCRPAQTVSWLEPDMRRLAQAAQRSAANWPADWKVAQPLYSEQTVLAYLRHINETSSLKVGNRPCRAAQVTAVRHNRLGVEKALDESSVLCPPAESRPPLDTGSLDEPYAGNFLAIGLVTPFLGLDRWVSTPEAMSRAVAGPQGMRRLAEGMTTLVPDLPSLVRLKGQLVRAAVGAENPPLITAFDLQANKERAAAQKTFVVLDSGWPSDQQCAEMGRHLRASVSKVTNVNALVVVVTNLANWSPLCPSQRLSRLDADALTQAFSRTLERLPEQWRAVDPSLNGNTPPKDVLDDYAQAMPPARWECLVSVLKETRKSQDTLVVGLLHARAQCAPSYQSVFLSETAAPLPPSPTVAP